MSVLQAAVLVLMLALLVAFATERFRIELVALTGLAIGVLMGAIPLELAFSGFASPAVITVAEVLLLVRVIGESHLIAVLARKLTRIARSQASVLALVCGLGAATSVVMNNIGALALWLPVALSLCRSTGVAPAKVLMPLSFATLLGGTCSIIGTPPNLLVSEFLASATGVRVGFFELAWIGVPITLVGLVYLIAIAPRLLPETGAAKDETEEFDRRRYIAELKLTSKSPLVGMSVAQAERERAMTVHTHVRNDRHVFGRPDHIRIQGGDVLLVEADADVIAEATRLREADLPGADDARASDWVEAVVLPQSVIVGSTARTIDAFNRSGIRIVAISSGEPRIEGRLADVRIGAGDILLLHGDAARLEDALRRTDCLALSQRGLVVTKPHGWLAVAAFAGAIAVAMTTLVAIEVALGAAILLLAITRAMDLRAAMAGLNWPILIMLAAMIPLGEAVGTTGAAGVIARALLDVLYAPQPALLALVMLVLAAGITPFVNNVSTAAVLAPIAIAVANDVGTNPKPLLVAVAIGASLDFLTPFGHHNNTIVLSVGGYRFRDFPRVGIPLVLVCLALAAALIGFIFAR